MGAHTVASSAASFSGNLRNWNRELAELDQELKALQERRWSQVKVLEDTLRTERAEMRSELHVREEFRRLEVSAEGPEADVIEEELAQIESALTGSPDGRLKRSEVPGPLPVRASHRGAFERAGATTKVTPASQDGGVDIVARFNGRRYAIQCKRFQNTQVGRPDCQQLLGVVARVGYAGGIMVTTDQLSGKAIDFCRANRLGVIHGSRLVDASKPNGEEGLSRQF